MLNFIKKASKNTQKANIDRSIERICIKADQAVKVGLNDETINPILSRIASIQADFIGPMSQREIRTNCFDPVLSKDGAAIKKQLLLYSLYSGNLDNEFSIKDVDSLDSRNTQISMDSIPAAFFNGLLLDCFKSALQLNGCYSFSKLNNETVQLAYIAAKKTFEQDRDGDVIPHLGVINFIALKYLTNLEAKGYDYFEAKIKEDYENFQNTKAYPKEYCMSKLLLKDYAFYDFNAHTFFLKYGVRVIDA